MSVDPHPSYEVSVAPGFAQYLAALRYGGVASGSDPSEPHEASGDISEQTKPSDPTPALDQTLDWPLVHLQRDGARPLSIHALCVFKSVWTSPAGAYCIERSVEIFVTKSDEIVVAISLEPGLDVPARPVKRARKVSGNAELLVLWEQCLEAFEHGFAAYSDRRDACILQVLRDEPMPFVPHISGAVPNN